MAEKEKQTKMFTTNSLFRHVEGDRITTRLSSASSYARKGIRCFKLTIEEYRSKSIQPMYKHAIYTDTVSTKYKRCRLFQKIQEPYTAVSNIDYSVETETSIDVL